jgi:hypothetical protein
VFASSAKALHARAIGPSTGSASGAISSFDVKKYPV